MTRYERGAPLVVIVNYGLGNLFSVQQACRAVGLSATISADRADVCDADAVILPGVGAFGDAMATLRMLDLVEPIRDAVAQGKPLLGLCLGIQLLMEESEEFGRHRGLGLVAGRVARLHRPQEGGKLLKVPQVGWNRVFPSGSRGTSAWEGSLLEGISGGEYMYFVHSFVAIPEDGSVVLARTKYGDADFCSSLQRGSVFACQFHPERSGRMGLQVYRNLRRALGEGAEKGCAAPRVQERCYEA